jgi:hypothetical protein
LSFAQLAFLRGHDRDRRLAGCGRRWRGAGKFAGIGSGGAGRASTGSPGSVRASRGAMIAFSTLAEPQTGQVTSARLACLS